MPISPVFGYYETQSIRPTLQLQEKTVVTQACALCQPSKGRAKDCLGKKLRGGWLVKSLNPARALSRERHTRISNETRSEITITHILFVL